MRIIEINQDMDRAGVSEMKEWFSELARSSEDVCLDLSQVRFLNSAGMDELVRLSNALRRRSLRMAIIHIQDQPLDQLRKSMLSARSRPELSRRLS